MKRFSLFKLVKSDRGAVIVELAFVAPVLATMIVGVVDMSNAFSRKLALEQGAQRAIEKILQTTDDTTVEATLAQEAVCQVNGMTAGVCNTSPITTSNVTVTYRLECTNSGGTVTTQSNTDSTTFNTYTCPGGTVTKASYISVSVTDKYTPMFPLRFAGLDNDGTYHLAATAGMRLA